MKATASAALVRRLRRRMGLTQEQFAREVGVTFSTVNQWENGRRHPQPFLLKRLLEMNVSIGEPTSKPRAKLAERKPSRGR